MSFGPGGTLVDLISGGLHRRRVPLKSTPEGQALFELMFELAQTFFRLRAAGKRIVAAGPAGESIGAVSGSGAGTWGLMRTLRTVGAQTVPQIARSRPVARQHIQRMVNELVEQDLVELVDNPAHRRSKLVRLTARGEAVYDELTASLERAAEDLARGMDADDLHTSVRVLKDVRQRLGAI